MTQWILCPIRNGLHYTKEALKTFFAQDIGEVSVLFINNDSQDGTARWLNTVGVCSIYMNPPLSVAQSWNYGLRWLFGPMRVNYVLVVNNDVKLRPDTYRHLVEDGGPFVTGVGVKEEEKIQPEQIYTDLHCYPKPDPAAKRPHPDFSCFLIRRECYEKVGPFDENFKIAFAEDCDYHVRLHKAGIGAYCLDLPFLHYGSQTIALADNEERRLISEQAEKNREYFYQKWGVRIGTPEYEELFQIAPSPTER